MERAVSHIGPKPTCAGLNDPACPATLSGHASQGAATRQGQALRPAEALPNVVHPGLTLHPVALVAARDAKPLAGGLFDLASVSLLATASRGDRVFFFPLNLDLFRAVEVLRDRELRLGDVAAARDECDREDDAGALHRTEATLNTGRARRLGRCVRRRAR